MEQNQRPTPAPPAAAAAAAAVQVPEDSVAEAGEAIDTFSAYQPCALPKCLIEVLSGMVAATAPRGSVGGTDEESESASNVPSSHGTQEVIEISGDGSCSVEEINCGGAVVDLTITNAATAGNSAAEAILPAKPNELAVPSHTSPACESALLASVGAPRAPDESARFLIELAKNKALSPLQLEGASLAITRHNRILVDSSNSSATTKNTIRAGFFIGDGAGVGKGRQIAAVLKDSMCRGRTRHLWVSVSRELHQDATRDMRDVGCHCEIHDGTELLDQTGGGSNAKGLGAGGGIGKGVLFVTYSLLISGKGRRMEEIISWLSGGTSQSKAPSLTAGKITEQQLRKINAQRAEQVDVEHDFDGVIIFDEAHKAKNLEADTLTARLVLKLQERLPHARVLYCSATGVSDIKHMVYATRLGLWGAGNLLYPQFETFRGTLESRGVGSMEMLALEMKQMGTFVARTLSWTGAEFETMELPLDQHQEMIYDRAVQWWFAVRQEIESALNVLQLQAPPLLWRAYWSAHQRFFKELAICAKVHSVAAEANEYMETQGCAIVIGMQSTGEASTQNALEELREQHALVGNSTADVEQLILPKLICTAASILTNFVRYNFPVSHLAPDPPEVPRIPASGFTSATAKADYVRLKAQAERIKSLPPPPPISELLERRRVVLESIRTLNLPPNPLDDLIDRLGGVDKVAEMTGRSGRVVRRKNGHGYRFEKRIGKKAASKGLSIQRSAEEADRLNLVEKRKFMDGKKAVAIISDAASTGISLHAAKGSGAANKRRIHYTIELPWAADKAIQQLGRTHRSNQNSAPKYRMVVTNLGGERRFAAAVAKRMASLGALTKGDRRAATGSDLSEFDIDSVYGRRALKRLYDCLVSGGEPSLPSRNAADVLRHYFEGENSDEGARLKDESAQHAFVLATARTALEDVGLCSSSPAESNVKSDIRLFLNRLAGLEVRRQNLLFALFMSTLDDVIVGAKATGEFEGSVEDVKATHIAVEEDPEQLVVDKSSGAPAMLTKVALDRGVSLESVLKDNFDSPASSGLTERDKDRNVAKGSNYSIAETGFYVSRRQIAGRDLILFARRKMEPTQSDHDRTDFDPRGLMVITRPNTGKNPCEKTSRDLNVQYRLLASHRDILQSDCYASVAKFSEKYSDAANMWNEAYRQSYHFATRSNLAPRRSKIGIVTGAVLHILPALEKAVVMRRAAERALRVVRVEISNSGRRLVGVRFPTDDDALENLQSILKKLEQARKGLEGDRSFWDEEFAPCDEKSQAWVTKERKTMRSFFGAAVRSVVEKENPARIAESATPQTKSLSAGAKRSMEEVKRDANKSRRITSFFQKR